jgi:Ca2+-binding RTX toxin-like protein
LTLTSGFTGGTIDLAAGTDTLTLANAVNTFTAVGVESIIGGTDVDIVTLTGTNTLYATGIETLLGGTGNDVLTLSATASGMTVDLGAGTADRIILAAGGNTLTIAGAETITGGSGTDVVTLGSANANTVNVTGVETLFGSAGDDVVTLTAAVSGISVDLGAGTADRLTLAAGANTLAVSGIETLSGTASADTLTLSNAVSGLSISLGNSNDIVTFGGAATNVTIDGGAGTDRIVLGNFNNTIGATGVETITGGSGTDRVAIAAATSVNLGAGDDDILDLSAIGSINLDTAGTQYQGIEKLDLRGGLTNTVTLNAQDVLDLSSTTDSLLVRGDAGDTVSIGVGGWTAAGTQSNPQGETGTFNVYTQSVGGVTATLLVESTMSVT